MLACYKPKGIASEGPLSFEKSVRVLRPGARLTHRLDTNTDGVLLFAKTEVAYREIFSAMKDGLIEKVSDGRNVDSSMTVYRKTGKRIE